MASILAFTVFSTSKVKDADGAFTKKDDNVVVNNNSTSKEEQKDTSKLDVSDFVGVYVKSYTLDNSIKYNDTCEVSKYDFVYEVKKDNSILRYIVNECFGKVLLSSDKLEYIGTGNSRNIGSKRAIYVFNGNKLSEVDGLTYVKNDKYAIIGSLLYAFSNFSHVKSESAKVSICRKKKYLNASNPCRSKTSTGPTTFPIDFDIFLPSPSITKP